MSAKIISEPAAAAVDIVLVHGWYEREPWTHENAACWPESILPALAPQARIITFNYDVKVEGLWAIKTENGTDSISEDLLWELHEVRHKTKTTDRPIILVAHSIGGLICENALVRASNGKPAYRNLGKRVQRLALVGTPFHTDKDRWAETGERFFQLCGANDVASLRDVPEKSEKLAEIGEKFQALIQSRTEPGSFEVACLYEGIATELEGRKVVIADESAVQIPGCPDPSRLEATHQGMVEVSEKNDAHFKRLSRVLVGWVEEIEEEQPDDEPVGNQYNANFRGVNRGFQLGQNHGGTIHGFRFGVDVGASNASQLQPCKVDSEN